MPGYILTFDYQAKYRKIPPIPVISLQLRKQGDQNTTTEVFIVDSGADITSIKKEIFELLELEYNSSTKISDAAGQDYKRLTALVQIETPFGESKDIEVIVEPDTDENLLGRDLINNWKVTLDGPNQQMTIEI